MKVSDVEKEYKNTISSTNISIENKNNESKVTLKSNEEIALEVINGLWDTGEERYNKLTEAGYDASEIQKIVNNKTPELVSNKPTNTVTSSNNSQISTEPIKQNVYDTASIIWKMLRGYGYSEQVCAGILGNIQQECGFNWNANSVSGIGLCQWGGSRRSSLINKYGNPPSLENQVKFMVEELQGYQQITNCQTVEEATDYFCYKFERPGIPVINKRRNYAEYWYNIFKS